MRKSTFILFSTFIFVLFAGGTVALGSWVTFNGGGNPAPPQIEVLGSDGTQTTVHITIPGMVVEEKEVDGQIYQVLRIPDDYATMLNVGEPELPAIRKQVGIPPTCNVDVSIVNQSYTELNGYLVYPFQQPLMEGEEPGPFVIDTVLYGTDSFYPQQITEVGTPAVWRDVRVTVLSLYPVSFNPVTGILRVYDDLTVQLNYSGTDGVNPLVNPPPVVSPSFDRMYRRALINYDYLGLDVSDVPLGYLIITPCGYVSGPAPLEPFVEWKRMKGIPVYVETFGPCIGDDPDEADTTWIKQTIEQYYHDYGIEYVLLVGCSEETPLYWYGGTLPSDYWYTIMDNDTTSDVTLGRFSAYSSDDVTSNVDKILAYERWPALDWNLESAVLVAHKEWYPHKYSKCKREICNDIMANSGFEVDTLMGGIVGVTNQDVVDAFESINGVGIVNYRGHGGRYPNRWAIWNLLGQSFTTADANALTNPDHLPVVYNVSCHNGAIQGDEEALVEAFTNNPYGGGSGSLGATVITYTEENHTLDKGLFKAAFDGYYNHYELGPIVNDAKNYMMTVWDFSRYSVHNARAYLWIGDPQMELWTKQPEIMEAEFPDYVETGEPTEVTVTVTYDGNLLAGALVCLYKPQDVFERGVTGTNGKVTLTVNPTSEGDLYLTVTKHNFHPFEGVVAVWVGVPPEAEVVPLTFSLSQNYPNPFNPSTTIHYTIPAVSYQQSAVSLKIYNVLGQEVRTLIDGQKEPGSHRVCWNCKDDGGQPVASGVYFYRLKAGGFTQVKRMLLLR